MPAAVGVWAARWAAEARALAGLGMVGRHTGGEARAEAEERAPARVVVVQAVVTMAVAAAAVVAVAVSAVMAAPVAMAAAETVQTPPHATVWASPRVQQGCSAQ